jgi:hypothetical protein
MEAAANRNARTYSRYGSTVHKELPPVAPFNARRKRLEDCS